METAQPIVFGSFRLDPHAQQLWRGEEALDLQARPLAVLQYLVARPGQIVGKEELLSAIWGATYVSKAVLKVAIRAIREALGERANAPQYIETVGRTGYRYIGDGGSDHTTPHAYEIETGRGDWIVGREAELAWLHDYLGQALQGERQLVFVTGEPGIGKSTLVDLFHDHLQSLAQTAVGYGQCVEQYGEGEPYLPILEALIRLCRQASGKHLASLLRQYAPTWAVSMPGVLEEAEQDALLTQVQGATTERRLRELADAIEMSCTQWPLVLLFEDLHWSDYPTLELLSYMAQRRERARLMIICTYRPEEARLRHHPLQGVRQELQARRCCRELAVELFTRTQVEAYLTERFTKSTFVDELAGAVHERTGGNALFMANLVDALVTQQVVQHEGEQWQLLDDVEQVGIPDSVQQLIRRQLERLPEEEQRLLEGASVAGPEFAVATVAAALQRELDSVEDACEQLAWQGLFLEESGVAEWADGTVCGQYRFRHVIYQQVLYERISAARQVRLHRLIGQRQEQGYGERSAEITAELAVHFERGRDYARALHHLQQAGQLALQRSANLEAIGYAERGLALLDQIPESGDRISYELGLLMTLAPALAQTRGVANPEVERVYARALALCQEAGETVKLFPVLVGLFVFYMMQADFTTAKGLVEQITRWADRDANVDMQMVALCCVGNFEFFSRDLRRARQAHEQCIALYDLERHRSHVLGSMEDLGVMSRSQLAWIEWYLGDADQALRSSTQARVLADELKHPPSQSYSNHAVALVHLFRREYAALQTAAETQIRHAEEQHFPHWLFMAEIFLGVALAAQGQAQRGVSLIRSRIDKLLAIGLKASIAFFLSLLVEACLQADDVNAAAEALHKMTESLHSGEEPFFEAEVYRLRGEVGLKGQEATAEAEAEANFQQALAIARREQVKALELRAAISLCRLWQQQDNTAEAQALLSEVYGSFTEGFETGDLTEARMLLQALQAGRP